MRRAIASPFKHQDLTMADQERTPVVTRFAPSPTGFLHIGGARTALFNWLFARHHGGQFRLRIEDTDRERHSDAAVDAILEGLTWLDIEADGPIVSQHANRQRHADIANALLSSGRAYRCYLTPEELESARNAAMETGRRFESPWRNADPETAPADLPFAVRFRAPQDGKTTVQDAVQGPVEIPNSSLDDLIILRSGTTAADHGGPTYNLAVVVDDHDMAVTHVIRGDDHLINAARQQQIYEALEWPVPVFAHIPLIHGIDGKKLSKRHGALGVEAYRDMGYLSDGLANYLLRLGWSHGDRELFSRDEAIALFSLEGINKAPARLDLEKLNHINASYVKNLADEKFTAMAQPFIEAACSTLEAGQIAMLKRAAPFLKERSDNLAQVSDVAAFLLAPRPFDLTGKTGKPLRKEGTKDLLSAVRDALGRAEAWDSVEDLAQTLDAFIAAQEISFGQIGPPLRAVLTGGKPSPEMGAVLYCLGRDEALSRIDEGLCHPDLA